MKKSRFRQDLDKIILSCSPYISEFPDTELSVLVAALEDRRFWKHNGVDFISLSRATFFYFIGARNGGASTIDMQLVRTITNHRSKSVYRKFNEVILAIFTRNILGGHAVICAYENLAYCGWNITGFSSASLDIFKCEIEECTREQKAILASLLLYPKPKIIDDKWLLAINARASKALRVAHLILSKS